MYHIHTPSPHSTSISISPSHIFSTTNHSKSYAEIRKLKKILMICQRLFFLFEILFILFLSLIVFEWILPRQFMRFTESSAEYSVPLHHFRRQVSGENKLHAVGDAGSHSNNTVTREVVRVKRREEGLARARAAMRIAALAERNLTPPTTHDNDIPAGAVYRNPPLFYQSYLEMEKIFKVYVYPDGDLPIVHDGPCKDIYSIEGRFLNEMEYGVGRFRTNDPTAAHVYFLPFSVTWMVKYLYTPNSCDITLLKNFVSNYVRVISSRYPFWNKTLGADHFMVACHDWGPYASEGNPFLHNTSIRVLCNANTSEGFNPLKDVSLPEIFLYGGEVSPKLLSPPPDTTPRRHLAFFAGGMHGPIRPILLHHWKNRDNDMRVYEYLPKDLDYYSFMLNSKFCLCPSGYEVASPRIVESIYAECVPVILSKNYTLPFSDVLRWEAFSVQVDVSDIPRLKELLSAIPENEYRKLKHGVRAVRRHFTLNHPAKRFDVFHMILHSIWLRRLDIDLR